MTKRLLSVLLAVLMIVTMIPVSAFAAETETTAPTVVNGYYENDAWVEGGNGIKTYTVQDANGNDSTIELSKTATPVEGKENTYEITLQVETSTNTVTQTNAGAVVLVIDVCGGLHALYAGSIVVGSDLGR